jgi:hypothetical protein
MVRQGVLYDGFHSLLPRYARYCIYYTARQPVQILLGCTFRVVGLGKFYVMLWYVLHVHVNIHQTRGGLE